MDVRVRGPWVRRWWIAFAAWTAVGVFAVVHAACTSVLDGRHPTWRMPVAWLANIWLWALWTGSLFVWARRLPMVRGRWGLHLVAHVALSLLYSAASTVFNLVVGQFLFDRPRPTVAAMYIGELFYNVVSYGAVVIIAHMLDYASQLAERRLRAVELERELARAQLAALEMQLRPHFLFNTLHGVSGLIRAGDPDTAIRMIGALGDLLRAVLDDDDAQELVLADELAFAERYLEIERIRFADRLRVVFEIAPAVLDAVVPRLILQPLLENSIRHGVQTHEAGGAVIVRAACRDQALELEVVDSGGRPDDDRRSAGHGIGLRNTRDRLRHLYGAAHRLEIERQPGGGTRVRITVPLRRGGAP